MVDYEDVVLAKNLKEKAAENGRSEGFNVWCAIGGVAVAAGLELLSPTGSKTSALVAGVVGGAATYYAKDMLDNAPQNDVIGGAAGIAALVLSAKAGRLAAGYFPGNAE